MENKNAPVSPSRGTVTPLAITDVQLAGGFWGGLQELNRDAIIPHSLKWMRKLGWVQNFSDAAAGAPYQQRGREFADSEVYKLIEAMAWDSVRPGGDAHLETIAELTEVIAGAQEPDGYLHTRYGRRFQQPRYFDMTFGHELYCSGHQLQSAVAVARTGANEQYVEIARQLADHVVRMFNQDGYKQICGHACIELGLVEFYRLTGEKKYLDQASIFVERHGEGSLPLYEFGRAYWQDHKEVRKCDVLDGHAVRALYLAASAVDVAVETEDKELLEALKTQWENTLAKRTYITGGMGSHHMDEAFGTDYVLPNDRSYCESCAGVASIMFSWRLLLATGENKYADLIERTLYNIVAVAPSREGTAFFYANTLHQRTEHAEPAFNEDGVVIRGGAAGRQPWFEVSCCPPNISRLLASLGGYVFSTEQGALNLHQYMGGQINTLVDNENVSLQVDTDLPHNGKVTIRVQEAAKLGVRLNLRVPIWVKTDVPVSHQSSTGEQIPEVQLLTSGQGTATFEVHAGDEISFEFPLEARFETADDRVDANRGCVAVTKGPLVYALESVDLPESCELDDCYVDTAATPIERDGKVYVQIAMATRSEQTSPLEPQSVTTLSQATAVSLVPYYDWAERGSSTMRIWMPVATLKASKS